MPLNRPPLMSQGQANDFYSYTAIGTGLFFLAGGLAAGPAAIALGLCGAGAVANNRQSRGRNASNPQMRLTPQQTAPPPPLTDGLQSAEAVQYVARVEADLKENYGINAVYCYRNMVREGHDTCQAYHDLSHFLGDLKVRGYWNNGRIQHGSMTPKQVLDQLVGRRVASPEMQQYINSEWFRNFYNDIAAAHQRDRIDPMSTQGALFQLSMMIYIFGLEPISDMPVRRIKCWADRQDQLYYVADWNWYCGGLLHQFRHRWERVLHRACHMFGMPHHLLTEAEDLFRYRVEDHISDDPPGHPGGVLLSSVLFGRTKSFSATEEDMRGKL